MSIGVLLRRAGELPPRLLFPKAAGFVLRQARTRLQRVRDLWRPSHARSAPDGALHAYARLTAADVPDDLAQALPAVAGLILDHRFDLLGSGWTAVHHGATCRGIEGTRYPPGPAIDADCDGAWLIGRLNAPNLAEGRRLWQLLDRPDYRPVDWQLDFKSGHRWSERTYFLDVSFGRAPGADIKVPWELARMQHLPWLALACLLARSGRPGLAPADSYSREVRSQILDFLATNPPRFGVNWRCPMDAAIRIANWLLALDILRGAGVAFDASFQAVVARSALEHGRHIAAHLEWSETTRSNHYLADIVGLLFVAAYLPCSAEADAWLAFAIQQLTVEIDNQFGADGGSFEGSVAYHCLSAELAAYGAALVLGLPREKLAALQSYDRRAIRVRPPFASGPMPLHDLPGAGPSPIPLRTFQRAAAMAGFLHAATKPDGRILQVGDTDSGRLFKLHPVWRALSSAEATARYASLDGNDGACVVAPYWDEDILDRRASAAALDMLVGRNRSGSARWLDARMIRALSGGRAVGPVTLAASPPPEGDVPALLEELGRLPADCRRAMDIPIPAGLDPQQELVCAAFPEFGLYVLRAPRFFVSLRCAGIPRAEAPSGHAHDDNLAVELQLDRRDLLADPGSYLYTPSPEIRERYRAAAAHFVPRPEGRTAVVPAGPFALRHLAHATCLHCGADGVAGRIDAADWHAWRVVELLPDLIRITDACTPGPLDPIPANPPGTTAGYGKLTKSPARSL